jgi:zinc D-Ala-D-Ala carboxypeptidase
MRPRAVLLDARSMPSLSDQIRSARRRRSRRRRAAAGALVAVPAALLAARLASPGATAEPAVATSITTTPTDATTASAPTGLQPGLIDAFGRAQASAVDDGYHLRITSGFRTANEQAALLEAEVAERGSLEEALWWVFPPDRSMHVQGLAIDVGDGPAADWLDEEGARFGLCRTLSWEWWHFEWRERWEAAGRCPAPAQTPDDAPLP